MAQEERCSDCMQDVQLGKSSAAGEVVENETLVLQVGRNSQTLNRLDRIDIGFTCMRGKQMRETTILMSNIYTVSMHQHCFYTDPYNL